MKRLAAVVVAVLAAVSFGAYEVVTAEDSKAKPPAKTSSKAKPPSNPLPCSSVDPDPGCTVG
jgi:hypothetical protein